MQRLRFLSLAGTSCLAALCLSDTALGQVPVLYIADVNQNVIADTDPSTGPTAAGVRNYSVQVNGTATESLTVTATSSTTISFQVANATGQSSPPAWLRVNNATGGFINIPTPPSVLLSIPLAVTANAAGLTPGSYSGSFLVKVNGQPDSTGITITVNLTVGGTTVLSANPASLTFTATQGATLTSPTSTTVVITSSTVALNYWLNPQSQGNWLQLSPSCPQASPCPTGGPGFTVSVNPAVLSTLPAGTYTGTITAQSTTTVDSVVIPVTLQINPSSSTTLIITPPNPPPFLYQIGGPAPASQQLTISSTQVISFSVASNAGWLVPSPLAGTSMPGAPATLTVSAAVSGLVTGTYDATLTISPVGGIPQQVPFRLVVSLNPLLNVSPTTMTFTAPFAGSPPATKTAQVTVTGTGPSVFFNATSNANWLTVTANQNFAATGSPATLTVAVNQTSLAVNTYTGTITITPNTGDNYTLSITVTMVVGTTTQISAGPTALLFSFQTTVANPPQQFVQIQSTGQPTQFSVSGSTNSCGATWLLVSPLSGTTPANLQVNVNAAGMPAGTCTGKITVTPASGNPIEVPVTVIIASTPLLTLSQPLGFGFESVQAGSGSVITRQLSVGSTNNTPVPFTVNSSASWLLVGGGGNTPQNVNVSINALGLLPGVYGGQITFSSSAIPDSGMFTIPVTLLVNPNISVSVSPTTLTFSMSQGGVVPAAQNLTLTNSGGNPTFTASIAPAAVCGTLLEVSPSSGIATGTITVRMLANTASVGTYACQIFLAFQNAATASTTINVTITITTARTLNVPSSPLTFNHQLTQAAPPAQKINITSSGGEVQFTVGTTSSPTSWLSSDTSTAVTPREIEVRVTPGSLPIGSYNGQVTISAPGVLQNPVSISVTLIIAAAPTPQPVTITSTASNLAGAISPGALITIKGTLLGPATPPNGVLFTLNAQGRIDPTLAGVRVLFDGIPGTPVFVSAGQDNVFAPYEIAGRLTTRVVVEYQGISSAPVEVRVTDAAPAIFTLNQQGFGQAAAVNQNGTFNGPPGGNTVPADIDTVIAVYTTGGGQTNPPSSTGSVTPTSLPLRQIPPVGSRSATIGGLPAVVEFAGAAPGLAAGVEQWNIRIPTPPPGMNLSGNQAIVITINGVSSPAGPTVAIR